MWVGSIQLCSPLRRFVGLLFYFVVTMPAFSSLIVVADGLWDFASLIVILVSRCFADFWCILLWDFRYILGTTTLGGC